MAFAGREAPGLAAAGDRKGFLWCIDLGVDEQHCRVRWSYKLSNPIRAVSSSSRPKKIGLPGGRGPLV